MLLLGVSTEDKRDYATNWDGFQELCMLSGRKAKLRLCSNLTSSGVNGCVPDLHYQQESPMEGAKIMPKDSYE